MDAQVFQILVLVFSLCITIIGAVVGFMVRSFISRYKEDRVQSSTELGAMKEVITARLNAHSTKLDDHERRITQNTEHINSNTKADEARMEFVKMTYLHIEQGISDIKKQQDTQQNDLKLMDRRLTDYMIKNHEQKSA